MLSAIPATVGAPAPAVFNVRAFGARGNGISNDEAAITRAADALAAHGSGTLLFPTGIYRDATPGTAVRFDGISNLTIRFLGGSTLLMDNLTAGLGTGDGILIQGHSSNDAVIGAHVKWKKVPAQRGFGFGIEFRGYPSDAQTIENAVVRNAIIKAAPQAGTIFMGCSDVTVQNFTAINTLADGLHFNACRRVTASNITGRNTGDDTLAFVTYAGATSGAGPFSEPALGEWSDSNSTATHVRSIDSHANGCRITGDLNVSISNLNVVNAIGAGIEIDSTIANGSTYSWTSGASRGFAVNGVTVRGCKHAVLVNVGNGSRASDPAFWQFDGSVKNVVARRTRSVAVSVSPSALGVVVSAIK